MQLPVLFPTHQGLPGLDGPPGPRGVPGCNGTKVSNKLQNRRDGSECKNDQNTDVYTCVKQDTKPFIPRAYL